MFKARKRKKKLNDKMRDIFKKSYFFVSPWDFETALY